MSHKAFLNFLIIILLFIAPKGLSQDLPYAKTVVAKLTSPKLKGRGYVGNGDHMAARYIAKAFKRNGAHPFGTKGYFQPYAFPINTLPSKITFKANGKELIPGVDYLVASNSPTTKGSFQLVWFLHDNFNTQVAQEQLAGIDLSDKFLVVPKYDPKFVLDNPLKARGILCLCNKKDLYWTISEASEVANHTTIKIDKEVLDSSAHGIQISFSNHFIRRHRTNNVLAYVPGTEVPDSFIVFTAHYDHLGMMGKETCFYGANDNASGTSMVLDLSRHFAKTTSKYSMVFITFSGEEAGLLGSVFCAGNPPFDLKRVKFLINLDMVGNGSEGITVVNASAHEKEFNILKDRNEQQQYLARVKFRGEACNSDHCPFHIKGVPSFFIYTMGKEYSEYHSVYDKGPLPFTAYDGLFKLLLDFTSKL